MPTNLNVRGPGRITFDYRGEQMYVDIGGSVRAYPTGTKVQVEVMAGDVALLLVPDDPPFPGFPENPLPPPTPPTPGAGSVVFGAQKQVFALVPGQLLSLDVTLPADTPVGAQGSIMVAEYGTGPMSREGTLDGLYAKGTTLEFRYIVARPALAGQVRLTPGVTSKLNVRTTRPVGDNCSVTVTAIPPK